MAILFVMLSRGKISAQYPVWAAGSSEIDFQNSLTVSGLPQPAALPGYPAHNFYDGWLPQHQSHIQLSQKRGAYTDLRTRASRALLFPSIPQTEDSVVVTDMAAFDALWATATDYTARSIRAQRYFDQGLYTQALAELPSTNGGDFLDGMYDLFVFDAQGRLISRMKLHHNGFLSLNISHYAQGSYYVVLFSNGMNMASGHFNKLK